MAGQVRAALGTAEGAGGAQTEAPFSSSRTQKTLLASHGEQPPWGLLLLPWSSRVPRGFGSCNLTRGLFPCRSSCESGQIVALKCSGERLSSPVSPRPLPASSSFLPSLAPWR